MSPTDSTSVSQKIQTNPNGFQKILNKLLRIYCFSILFFLLLPSNKGYAYNFEVHSENPKLKQDIQKTLDSSYRRLSDFFGDSATPQAMVFVTQNDKEFDSLVGGSFPDWGIAAAVPEQNLIVLKSPIKYGYSQDLPRVLMHELAHLYLGNKVNRQNFPRWLDEGFAMYMAEEWRWSLDLSIAKAVFTNSILNLVVIDSVNSFNSPKAHLAYLESFLAINYFIQQYGEDNFKQLINLLAGGKDINSALVQTIGLNHLQFSDEFSQYLKKKYSWISFFSDTFLLWLLLAFLVITFYFMKKMRSRKIMQDWEKEESWPKEN